MTTLAERLTEAMRASSISQAELARACGVKPPSVSGWLSGKSKFLRGENLLAAAKALNVSESWLATGLGPMKVSEIKGNSYPMAHPVSLQIMENSPKQYTWNEAEKMGSDIEGSWWMNVIDNAVSPSLREGQIAEFTKDVTPIPGDDILIVDSKGKWFIRQYYLSANGEWIGKATGKGYPDLDPGHLELKIFAVRTGLKRRGSDEN